MKSMIALAKHLHFRVKNKSSESTITRKNIHKNYSYIECGYMQ